MRALLKKRILVRHRGCRLLAAVLSLAALTAACTGLGPAISPPRYHLVDVRFLDARLLEQRYTVTFRVQNPNDVDIPVRGMALDLSLAGQPFATGVGSTPVTLPAYGEAEVSLNVSANMLKAMARLAQVLQDRPTAITYRLSGHLSVDLPMMGRLPVDAEGEIRLDPRTVGGPMN